MKKLLTISKSILGGCNLNSKETKEKLVVYNHYKIILFNSEGVEVKTWKTDQRLNFIDGVLQFMSKETGQIVFISGNYVVEEII